MRTINPGKLVTLLAGIVALAGSSALFAENNQPGGGYEPPPPPPKQSPSKPDYNRQAPMQQQQQAQNDFSKQELKAFAEAREDVKELVADFQSKAKNAEDPKKIGQMRQQVNEDMVTAVQEAGLQPQKYNQIFKAMQQDPQLANRIQNL